MHWLDYLQWPAMLVTVVAAWLVASAHRRRRKVGFWVFLASNLLWIAWGLYAQAYALHDGGRSPYEGCAQCAPSLFSSGWPA